MDEIWKKTTTEQLKVLARAVDILEERTKKYGEPWQEANEIDIAHMARHKVHRAYHSVRRRELGQDDVHDKEYIIDSCLDGINYLAFLIRMVEQTGGGRRQAQERVGD